MAYFLLLQNYKDHTGIQHPPYYNTKKAAIYPGSLLFFFNKSFCQLNSRKPLNNPDGPFFYSDK